MQLISVANCGQWQMPVPSEWTGFHGEWAEPSSDRLSCTADPFDDFDEDDFDDDFDDDFEEEWDDELAGDTEFQSDLADDEGGDADFDD